MDTASYFTEYKEPILSISSFSALALPQEQLSNLAELGYEQMTPVQAATLPLILNGSDVLAQAKTGSGKTAAFGIGLLAKIKPDWVAAQALILCPTRELADQVAKEIRRLARFMPNIKVLTLCGGVPMSAQLNSLTHPPHIVVGTPGRIYEHLRKQTLVLNELQTLVLDEADRMLDMGFADIMADILPFIPAERQTLLFSATYPDEIAAISRRFQRDPQEIRVEAGHEQPQIKQLAIEVSPKAKDRLLRELLSHYKPASCVVFCNTKRDTQSLYEQLAGFGNDTLALHGDLEQRDRDRVLLRFSNGSCRILVATDVAARGLDIKDLAMVVNYELPHDPEVYVHRIGRTGRAGMEGIAISLCEPQEMSRVHAIEDYTQKALQWQPADNFQSQSLIPLESEMMTICIDGGRKAKIRPGDILGALTGDAGLKATEVGKITISDIHAYVAIRRSSTKQALQHLKQGKIKGKGCRAVLLK